MAAADLYSRFVAVLKVALPLVALGMLSALFLIQTDDRLGGDLVFSRGDLAALGSGLRVSDATFSGTTRNDDRFRFTAALVEPDAAPPTRAAITALAGTIALRDGPTVSMRAGGGDLDIASETLNLAGEVEIETSDGFRMRTEAMVIDLRGGTLTADGAVAGDGPLGRIDAGNLRIIPAEGASGGTSGGDTDDRRFFFGNGVRVIYDPAVTSN